MIEATHERAVRLGASMGPRPIGRGNSAERMDLVQVVGELQWGRDRSVAEILRMEVCGFQGSVGARASDRAP